MSSQHDDDGTVIRPDPLAAAAMPAVTLPGQIDEDSPPETEDGLSLRIGTRLAEFEITKRIGEGGFSIVYLARDHSLERTVALKEYMPSSLAARVGSTQVQPRSGRYRDTFHAGLKSFVNEAKLLAQFDHPSLVKVYRFWEANGTAYMVMPFYRGVTVKDAIRAMPEPPDEAWLLALLAPLTEALMVIHAEHCYHRDIAPDNVILLAGSGKPLLLDFGAARRVIGDMTQGLTVILKAGYAPVEQYAEVPGMKQGTWTDVYALAAVVYWAITGSTPPASVARMMSDSFVPLTQCAAGRYSHAFLDAVDRALVVRPEQRTHTIEDFRRDLGIMDGDAEAAGPQWDPDATVIRPAGPRTRTTPTAPATAAQVQADDAPSARRQIPDRAQPTRSTASSIAEEPKPGGRRILIAGVAAGAAVALAGAWWAVQRPGTETVRPPTQGAASAPADAPSAVVPSVASMPADKPAMTTQIPPAATTTESPAVVSPSVSEAAPQPSIPPTDRQADPPPPPTSTEKARQSTQPRPATAPRETAVERPSKRADTSSRERAPGDTANGAECARIMQRLSLGETRPELVERLRTLKCR